MKLLLLIFASLFHLSSGFMAELTGSLTQEECTGTEYADFKACVVAGFEEAGEDIYGGEDEAFINHGRDRDLRNNCSGCPDTTYVGHFCFTCCGGRRRHLEQGTENTGGLRGLQAATAVDGEVTSGEGEALMIAETILLCLGDHSALHPCLGSTNEMDLTVTL
jgi:hypothetical protein